MIVLPDPDITPREFTAKMRSGWELAEECFDVPAPEPPRDEAAENIQDWAENVLERWVQRKSRVVSAARRELDAAAEEAHRQRIMAGAIVGLMYEDVAKVLRAVPVPTEFINEPEIADAYRDILEFEASPFLEHARRAYRACAANADGGPEGMRHWRSFCAGRLARLPPPRGESTGVAGSSGGSRP